jgi:hypothetical protein
MAKDLLLCEEYRPGGFHQSPPYAKGSPGEKYNWTYNSGNTHAETNQIYNLIVEMHESGIPSPDDLVCTFITRRVCPLQRHTHKISQMSGSQDQNQYPNRMTPFELEKPEVVKQVKGHRAYLDGARLGMGSGTVQSCSVGTLGTHLDILYIRVAYLGIVSPLVL